MRQYASFSSSPQLTSDLQHLITSLARSRDSSAWQPTLSKMGPRCRDFITVVADSNSSEFNDAMLRALTRWFPRLHANNSRDQRRMDDAVLAVAAHAIIGGFENALYKHHLWNGREYSICPTPGKLLLSALVEAHEVPSQRAKLTQLVSAEACSRLGHYPENPKLRQRAAHHMPLFTVIVEECALLAVPHESTTATPRTDVTNRPTGDAG